MMQELEAVVAERHGDLDVGSLRWRHGGMLRLHSAIHDGVQIAQVAVHCQFFQLHKTFHTRRQPSAALHSAINLQQ